MRGRIRYMRAFFCFVCALLVASGAGADPPAASLFGAEKQPFPFGPLSVGSYARGCISGAVRLPETGPDWQAMRLSRNRNWGHPRMVGFLERLAARAREVGWPGIYVGDIGQPRGGPMLSGHRSHQIGLDADIWLLRPGDHPLSVAERERVGSINVVDANGVDVNANWTRTHHLLIRAAAEDPDVARIFVNPAIKLAMCRAERGPGGEIDAPWLRKVRPWKGHDHHFHVRLHCPRTGGACREQAPPPPGDGCGAELASWFPDGVLSQSARLTREDEEAMESKPRTRGLSDALALSDLPPACSAVLHGDREALASLAPGTERETAPAAPVFTEAKAEAHTGFLGTRYFWSPPVDLNAAGRRGVALAVEGELPPGLQFRDRGGGHGLLSGVPEAAGSWTFEIVARDRGAAPEKFSVTVPIVKLRAETAAAADLPSLDYRVRDFIANFTGSECFLATPVTVSLARIEVEAFADDSASFHDFDAAFRTAIDAEARIGGRLVTRAQCEALAFVRAFPNRAPPRITLSEPDRVLAPGQPLQVAVTGDSVRYITPLLVGPDGSVVDLSDHMKLEGPVLMVDATPVGTGPHLLLAVDTVFPLVRPDYATTGDVDILENLRTGDTARNFDMKVSASYFVVE